MLTTIGQSRLAPGEPRNIDGLSVRLWLFSICALIFAMVIVGGATRLTDSGLSITEWKPLLGAIPPLSDADWHAAFEKYKTIPEYHLINRGMSLAEFKFIYWWEWAHRFLGRIIGLVFFVPMLFFWLTGRLSARTKPRLVLLFVLGALQGGLGWFMVMSGLVERVDVSQYRLAAHLSLAVLIMGYAFWVALRLGEGPLRPHLSPALRFCARLVVAGVFVQIILGGFVAGMRAGSAYNTWPKMDGQWIPDGLGAMSPWFVNFFENAMTVQFNHRMFAYLLALGIVLHTFGVLRRHRSNQRVKESVWLLFGGLFIQVGIGVWTLISQVPISLGLLHQGMALVVFLLAIFHVYRCCEARSRQPITTRID